jgi:hypothetical protein
MVHHFLMRSSIEKLKSIISESLSHTFNGSSCLLLFSGSQNGIHCWLGLKLISHITFIRH